MARKPRRSQWLGNVLPRRAGSHHRRLRFEALEDRRLLSVTVNTLVDENNGISVGGVSLREAIAAAAAGETIDFSVTGEIRLGLGQLIINKNLTIQGPGADLLTIRAHDPTPEFQNGDGARIFNIDDGNPNVRSTVTLSGLTLTGADVDGHGGAMALVQEDLNVVDSAITGNFATLTGGAISHYRGNVTIIGSTISGNWANQQGGGIFHNQGQLAITGSTISGNTSVGRGGGIYAGGTIELTGSTVSGNRATHGGGIELVGTLLTLADSTLTGNIATAHGGGLYARYSTANITQATFSGNQANGSGGAIYSRSTVNLRHSTIAGNIADADIFGSGEGGGLRIVSATTTLDHSIVAGNTRRGAEGGIFAVRDDVSGSATARYSLIGVNTGATITNNGGNQIGTGGVPIDARLVPLANYGGPTKTHALFAGSPAIDAGDPDFDPADPDSDPLTDDAMPFDQRGEPFVRVHGARIDIGAFERQTLPPGVNLVVDTTSDVDDGDHSPGNLSLREAILLANVSVGANSITFSPLFNSPQTISVAAQLPTIRDSLTITGPGAHLLTIDAGHGLDSAPGTGDGWRIFHIDDDTDVRLEVTLRGLTLTGGDVAGGIVVAGHGGAIAVVRENLNIVDSVISGNFATLTGGAISDYFATVAITGSTISGNSTAGHGGGIFHNQGTLTITRSTISGNSGSIGGGMSSYGAPTIVESTFSGNSATHGGGISHKPVGNLLIERSTFSGNTATARGGGLVTETTGVMKTTIVQSTFTGNSAGEAGGGILNDVGELVIRHSTITNNTGPAGAGGGVASRVANSQVDVYSSIVSGNPVGGDVQFVDGGTNPFSSLGYNLVGTGNGVVGEFAPENDDIISSEPGLIPLSHNGGLTQTHALWPDSPAIDVGDPDFDPDDPDGNPMTDDAMPSDQREAPFVRVFGGRIDIGAYEAQTVAGLNLVVDSAIDESDGDYSVGDLSLREAIGLANGSLGPDTITFAAALAGQTITLVGGELEITEALTIDATALAQNVTINANQQSRILTIIAATGDFNLAGLTLTGGGHTGLGGAILSASSGLLRLDQSIVSGNSAGLLGGGGIYAVGDVALNRSTISGNSATGGDVEGGGIRTHGNVRLDQSTVSGNSTLGINSFGGGISASGTVTLNQSIVSGNSAAGTAGIGGGLRAGGEVRLDQSTVSGNSTLGNGALGGGIFAGGAVTLIQSTVSGNRTMGSSISVGGGIIAQGAVMLTHSTVTENHVDAFGGSGGGGVVLLDSIHDAPISIDGSIVAGNTRGNFADDLAKDPDSPLTVNHSLIGTGVTPGAGANNVTADDPQLGPLQYNGGPTFLDGSRMLTHVPMPGSPAINAGNLNFDPDAFDPPLVYDQRGGPFVRVAGGQIDIGAVESQPMPPAFFGDYNQNGVVDAADSVVWRNTLGQSVAPFSGADGSGNGIVDEADRAVWMANFGRTLGSGNIDQGAGSGEPEAGSGDALASIAADPHPLDSSRPLPRGEVVIGAFAEPGVVRWLIAPRWASHSRPIGPRPDAAATMRDDAFLAWLASAERTTPHDEPTEVTASGNEFDSERHSTNLPASALDFALESLSL